MWRWSFSQFPRVAWQSQTPICFPGVITGVYPVIKSWEKHLSKWARCQKAIGGIYLTKTWRAETLQPGLEFDNIKPRLESGVFYKCISWLNRWFFEDFWRFWLGFSGRGSQDLSEDTNVASWTLHVFTAKAPNFGPHGNFVPLFQKGLISLKLVLQKNKENKSWRKTLDLQIRFFSFFVHDSSTEATELARKSPKFPRDPKLEAFTVPTFTSEVYDIHERVL